MPEAIIAFLDSRNYEDAIRKAISLGGDSDTLACIAGGIAQAYYGSVPPEIVRMVRGILPEDLLRIVDKFNQRFGLIKRLKGPHPTHHLTPRHGDSEARAVRLPNQRMTRRAGRT